MIKIILLWSITIILLLLGCITDINSDPEEVSCYDRYGNEIQELTCMENPTSTYTMFGALFLLISILITFGLLFERFGGIHE